MKKGSVFLVLFALVVGVILLWRILPQLYIFYEYRVPLSRSIETKTKRVALTFDDGPFTETTRTYLQLLDQYHVRATFFLQGNHVDRHPELVKEIINHQHAIGNHTWSHPSLFLKSKSFIRNEIVRTDRAIYDCGYPVSKPIPFRPPYGLYSAPLMQVLTELKKKHIYFHIDPKDFDIQHDERSLATFVSRRLFDGCIVLLHESPLNCITICNMLRLLLPHLKNQGFECVTIQ